MDLVKTPDAGSRADCNGNNMGGINRVLIPLGLQSCSKDGFFHYYFHYYSFRTVANSQSGSTCCTELSEVLKCVSWLLTVA